jgi:hypothetical protein
MPKRKEKICQYCGYEAVSDTDLADHMYIYHGADSDNFINVERGWWWNQ